MDDSITYYGGGEASIIIRRVRANTVTSEEVSVSTKMSAFEVLVTIKA